MNLTTVVVAILALLAGTFVGSEVLDTNDDQQGTGAAVTEELATPLADDFFSARPELAALPTEALSDDERAGLLYMREEEKLARDVYTTLYEKWGLRIFSNIAQSEQTHTEAVRDLLVKYDIPDPVTDDSIGAFTVPELASLYESLVEKGSVSLEQALVVGATIEDLDIQDLHDYAEQVDNQDITLVYENLTRGSRNHLRSFVSQLEARGETYAPQYIAVDEYESIVSTDRETGTGSTQGQTGSGKRGWGRR